MIWLWWLLPVWSFVFSVTGLYLFDTLSRRALKPWLEVLLITTGVFMPSMFFVSSAIAADILTDPVLNHSIYDQMAIKLFWSM